MRNDGLCSIQEYNTFKDRIFDAVDEWLNYNDADPNVGISLNPSTLEVEVRDKSDTQPGNEWYDIAPLVADGEAEASAVLDFAD
ncbi:MAG: hypothetical protein K2O88_02130 [Paramuribaculum sp.]|nr:hypothetical protein [Paramuribaculum sp.]